MKLWKILMAAMLLAFTGSTFGQSVRIVSPEDGSILTETRYGGLWVMGEIAGIPKGEEVRILTTLYPVDGSIGVGAYITCDDTYGIGFNYRVPQPWAMCTLNKTKYPVLGITQFAWDAGTEIAIRMEVRIGGPGGGEYYDEVIVTYE